MLSTLDYILGPQHLANLQPTSNVNWGIHKSDHACLTVHIDESVERGCGMFRPNLAFLDCLHLRTRFVSDYDESILNMPQNWDPHKRLEFSKVMLRTIVAEYSNKYRKQNSDHIKAVRSEIDMVNRLKCNLLTNNPDPFPLIKLQMIDSDLDILNLKLDELLVIQTKLLAQRSRVKWLELGEK